MDGDRREIVLILETIANQGLIIIKQKEETNESLRQIRLQLTLLTILVMGGFISILAAFKLMQ